MVHCLILRYLINRKELIKMFNGKIIKAGMNAKTIKGDGSEFETAIFYGTPFKMFIEKAGKSRKSILVPLLI